MNNNYTFTGEIKIIGINPYVQIPQPILESISNDADRQKGPIPVTGTVNGKEFKQTLVKYAGESRFYINTTMLKSSPSRIGEKIEIVIRYDPDERVVQMHPLLKSALEKNPEANSVFEALSPSKQKEIKRYISSLKTEETIILNVTRAIGFLLGKGRFVGRSKP